MESILRKSRVDAIERYTLYPTTVADELAVQVSIALSGDAVVSLPISAALACVPIASVLKITGVDFFRVLRTTLKDCELLELQAKNIRLDDLADRHLAYEVGHHAQATVEISSFVA